MTFPFWNLLGVSITSVSYLDLYRVTLCLAPSLFVAVTSNRTLEIALWKRKYSILFQLCQGQSSIIPAVNSLLTSKGCIYRCFNTQNYIKNQNLSLGFILKIFLKFRKFQPRYSYKIYSYKKKSVV